MQNFLCVVHAAFEKFFAGRSSFKAYACEICLSCRHLTVSSERCGGIELLYAVRTNRFAVCSREFRPATYPRFSRSALRRRNSRQINCRYPFMRAARQRFAVRIAGDTMAGHSCAGARSAK
jgi:hypothetical protein